jgi:hypothetical protein
MPKASAILSPVPSVSSFHNLTVGAIVDRLGALKAQLADLKGDEAALRGELIARKVEAADGICSGRLSPRRSASPSMPNR